jgi:hypothetical protein
VNLADPLVNANGAPMGPQEPRWNIPVPYRKSEWRLRDIVDYGNTAALAGMAHVANATLMQPGSISARRRAASSALTALAS